MRCTQASSFKKISFPLARLESQSTHVTEMAIAAAHSSCRGLGFPELNSKRLELKKTCYKN